MVEPSATVTTKSKALSSASTRFPDSRSATTDGQVGSHTNREDMAEARQGVEPHDACVPRPEDGAQVGSHRLRCTCHTILGTGSG